MQKNSNKTLFIGAKLFATVLFVAFFALNVSLAEAATYSWYFSNSVGNDTTGDGTAGKPWKSLAKVQTKENTLSSSDTATFYFRRGDIWTFSHTGSPSIYLTLDNCPITIDAYGTGNRPIFDGGVTSWVTNPLLVGTREQWNAFIGLGHSGSAVKNIEVKRHHGNALYIKTSAAKPVNSTLIQNCYLHDLGAAGLHTDSSYFTHGNVIEFTTVHDSFNQQRYFYTGSYAGAINYAGLSTAGSCYNNTVRYCNVYNNYGEGIWNMNGITEYNVIGPTFSGAIHTTSGRWPAGTSIIRHNIITSVYGTPYYGDGKSGGIVPADDETEATQDNSNGESWVYGNIIAGRPRGIRVYDNNGNSAIYPFGKLRIFNNTIIDSNIASIMVNNAASFADVKIYNNSSIFYSTTLGEHIQDYGLSLHAGWDIKNNHFWSVSARSVDSDWDTGYQTGDPKLPKTSGWRSMSTDKDTIDFATFFYPLSGSALMGKGMTLSSEFDGMTELLTQGTDLTGGLDSSSFVMKNQASPFSLGAVLILGSDTIPPSAPQGLAVE